MYAAALKAQRSLNHLEVRLKIETLWERFKGRGGLHQIEALCSALHDEGCEERVVEEAKDAYMAALIGRETAGAGRVSLGNHLNSVLRAFIEEINQSQST